MYPIIVNNKLKLYSFARDLSRVEASNDINEPEVVAVTKVGKLLGVTVS